MRPKKTHLSLSNFLPPITLTILQKMLQLVQVSRKSYPTYQAALQECTENSYENEEIVDVVLEKTKKYCDSLNAEGTIDYLNSTSAVALCSFLAANTQAEINVIDFGGACGAHYFLARSVLPNRYKLNWIVVETPAMAKKASVLANDELRFLSSVQEAAQTLNQVDLLYTSGTLQCVDDPQQHLKDLVAVQAEYMLFNRLALTPGSSDIITIHESWLSWNGPGALPSGRRDHKVRYPMILMQAGTFYDALKPTYDVVMTFNDANETFTVQKQSIAGIGLLARRTS